jgi:hypothetical protein
VNINEHHASAKHRDHVREALAEGSAVSLLFLDPHHLPDVAAGLMLSEPSGRWPLLVDRFAFFSFFDIAANGRIHAFAGFCLQGYIIVWPSVRGRLWGEDRF